jgi:hypothetical protein
MSPQPGAPIVDPGADPNTGYDPWPSLGDAQSNQLLSSKVMVSQLNNNLTIIYNTAFANWALSVNAGRIPNTNYPVPPMAYVVGAPDASGFQWPVVGTSPVCAVPPIPADIFTPPAHVPAGTIDVGHSIGGKWFAVGPMDTFPVDGPSGGETPPVPNEGDPTLHTYQKYSAPVGAGWYLQTS